MRWARAPAKVNLTLRVLGVRADGYHELDSLVAFGAVSDWLGFEPGGTLDLTVEGPNANEAGPVDDNLVLKAVRAMQFRVPNLKVGRFHLVKRLPTAAGLGGGSADAAAALRWIAEANGLPLDDSRLVDAAEATGADVPVCLYPLARVMSGVGHALGPALRLPGLFAVLANPRIAVPTGAVFKAYDAAPQPTATPVEMDRASISAEAIQASGNDLEPAARKVAPVIDAVLEKLAKLPGAQFARMSGSGATCFALFDEPKAAAAGALRILAERPDWWVVSTALR
jgi:4-diphosphocytidyl-2-C-methyl-D-erythritol kinase